MLAGCQDPAVKIKNDLQQAETSYKKRDFPAATQTLNGLIKAYPERPETADAYYLRALCSAATSNKPAAAADAVTCVRLAKSGDLRTRAHATAASVLFESNRTSEAIPHFEQAVKSMPEQSPKDLLRFHYGECLMREGRWKEAKAQFAAVYKQFPQSSSAQKAKALSDWPYESYAIQCGAFRDKKIADETSSKLSRAGLSCRVEQRPRSGEMLYMVYAGKYSRYDEARDALPAVQRQAPGAIIAP